MTKVDLENDDELYKILIKDKKDQEIYTFYLDLKDYVRINFVYCEIKYPLILPKHAYTTNELKKIIYLIYKIDNISIIKEDKEFEDIKLKVNDILFIKDLKLKRPKNIPTPEYINDKNKKITKDILSKLSTGNIHSKNEKENNLTFYHILNSFSINNNLKFLIVDKMDIKENIIDHSYKYGVINQNSTQLLNQLNIKFILKLDEDYSKVPTDNKERLNYEFDFKKKLSNIINVDIKRIIIIDIIKGSVCLHWTVEDLSQNEVSQILTRNDDEFRNSFNTFVEISAHPLFFTFGFDISQFNSNFNRDYSIMGNNQITLNRGSKPYYLPMGCKRFGLNVDQKISDFGNEWIGDIDSSWEVIYH
jgi:hypothetical protein